MDLIIIIQEIPLSMRHIGTLLIMKIYGDEKEIQQVVIEQEQMKIDADHVQRGTMYHLP